MILTRIAYIVCAASLLVGENAYAEDSPGETIYIVDESPDADARDRERLLGEAPFVTVIHADEHGPTASVADALATTAGVQLTSTGGLGAFQSISVRGASPGHTSVLVDGLPLARIAAVTQDLGRFSLSSFGTIELYRGAVPVEMGGAGIGGAVNLVTRLGRGENGERIHASAGVGSYGAMHVRARYGDNHGEALKSSTTIGYEGAAGDFSFFDNNGTTLNTTDDRYLTRQNNRFDRVDLASRVGTENVAGGLRASYQRQGLPGATNDPTMTARLSTLDVIADGQGTTPVGAATERHVGYVLFERQDLHDPEAELSMGRAERAYTTLSGGASSTWTVAIADHRAAAGVEIRGDRFSDKADDGSDAYTGHRVGGAITTSVDLVLSNQLVVTPAVRLDVQRTAPTPETAGPDEGVAVDPRWDTVPSPRISVRTMLRDDLVLKGSTGWYTRLPTLIEVFGNRGVIVGSPDLRAETGPSSDVGIVWAPANALGAFDRVLVQGDVFANRSRDTIAYVATVGYAARAVNLDDTQAYGGELVLGVRIAKLVSLMASYTRLETVQLSDDMNLRDNPIPRRPDHLAYGKAELAHRVFGRDVSVWGDAAYQSQSTLDRTALQVVPARVLVGTGARVEVAYGFAVSGRVANILDERIAYLPLDPPPSPTLTEAPTALTDVTGFPLPGRSFYLSLEWTH